MQIREAINEIIFREGINILKNVNRFNAMLDDLAPECIRERKVFRASLDENVLSIFFCADKEQRLRKLVQLKNELSDKGISDEWIRIIVGSFEDSIGWEKEISLFLQQEFANSSFSSMDRDNNQVKVTNEKEEKPITNVSIPKSNTSQDEVSVVNNIVNLGIMAVSAGDLNKAIIQFEKALEKDGSCLGAFLGLASVLDTVKSKPYVERLLDFDIKEIEVFLRNNPGLNTSKSMVDNLVCWGKPEVLEIVLKMNGKISEYALFYAVRTKYWKEVIRVLIKYHVDIKKVYSVHIGKTGDVDKYEKRTVLSDVFMHRGDDEFCKELIRSGANIEYGVTWLEYYKNSLNGPERYASMISLAIDKQGHELLEPLLDAGANPNEGMERYVRKGYGHVTKYPPLSDAFWTDSLKKYVDILIEHGADTNHQYTTYPMYTRNDNSKIIGIGTASVLMEAILCGDSSMIKKMLNAGANPNITYTYADMDNEFYWKMNEWTKVTVPILDVAIRLNDVEAIQLLIDAGASFEEKCFTHNGSFPLSVRDFGKNINENTKQLIKKYGWKGHKLFKDTYIWYAF